MSKRPEIPLTLPEAAVLLGLSASTLRTQVRKGRLVAVKRGRDLWIAPSEIERYRDQQLGTRRPRA